MRAAWTIVMVVGVLLGLSAVALGATVTVAPGETLSDIAARNGTTAGALARANGIADPDMVVAGTRLRLSGGPGPAATAVSSGGGALVVRPGETLGDIAARHGTTAGALARANGIGNPDMVVAGTRLSLAGASGGSGGAVAGTSPAGAITVRPGETLSDIAARHGTTAGALARANGIRDPDMVVAGTRLSLTGAGTGAGGPASTVSGGYTVRPGETLSDIAARHGTTVAALAAANGIADPDTVVAGRTLVVTGGSGRVAPAAAGGRGVADLLSSRAAAHGVDPALARAIAWQESGFSQAARSEVGAVGVMQLMPATAAWFGPVVLGRPIDPHRLEENVDAGVAYLAWLQRQSGSRDTAIAAYYQGLTSVRRNGNLPETDRYVANVLAHMGRV